jgi:hypothetical protein
MFYFLLFINFCFFILGNIVYSPMLEPHIPSIFVFGLEIPIIKILISELAFICLYTFLDKGNTQYSLWFPFLSLLITWQFLFPHWSFLFYSEYVQYFSIGISSIAIIINTIVVKRLVSKGYTRLFSSRTASIIASIVEISMFAFLLDIGVQGAISTALTRIVYIAIIPRWVFKKK